MIRPVDVAPTQLYGDNPTRYLPWDSWLIQTFGNYQPDGHTGEDYPCEAGTPVRAVTAGTVLHVGRLSGAYADNPWWIAPAFAGYVVVIDHGWFIGIYGHCADGSGRVKKNQRVNEGEVVVLSGNTGASTGDHLHFEALLKGAALNGYMYGRIDPAQLFTSSLAFAGTTTPIEEDELSAAAEAQIARIHQILEAQETDRIRERVIAIDDRTAVASSKYLKGDQEATLYAFEDGKLRGINLTEWQATGLGYRTLPQAIIDALPREN